MKRTIVPNKKRGPRTRKTKSQVQEEIDLTAAVAPFLNGTPRDEKERLFKKIVSGGDKPRAIKIFTAVLASPHNKGAGNALLANIRMWMKNNDTDQVTA